VRLALEVSASNQEDLSTNRSLRHIRPQACSLAPYDKQLVGATASRMKFGRISKFEEYIPFTNNDPCLVWSAAWHLLSTVSIIRVVAKM
jgi:hypothetical protein